mmetsp:Transcript_22611/g.33203  ORF Transcript_22611/g.33203 Transcript_22611/m.33203 type:complete len:106 (+) Transcript_22611:44-361(+)
MLLWCCILIQFYSNYFLGSFQLCIVWHRLIDSLTALKQTKIETIDTLISIQIKDKGISRGERGGSYSIGSHFSFLYSILQEQSYYSNRHCAGNTNDTHHVTALGT